MVGTKSLLREQPTARRGLLRECRDSRRRVSWVIALRHDVREPAAAGHAAATALTTSAQTMPKWHNDMRRRRCRCANSHRIRVARTTAATYNASRRQSWKACAPRASRPEMKSDGHTQHGSSTNGAVYITSRRHCAAGRHLLLHIIRHTLGRHTGTHTLLLLILIHIITHIIIITYY